jgi:hypothetical protein
MHSPFDRDHRDPSPIDQFLWWSIGNIGNHKSQTTNHKPRTTNLKPPTTNHKPQTTTLEMTLATTQRTTKSNSLSLQTDIMPIYQLLCKSARAVTSTRMRAYVLLLGLQ